MLDFVFHPGGVWRQADAQVSELPQPNPEAPSAASQLLFVAGGLALVLSRCSAQQIQRDFPCTNELYRLLRRELRHRGTTTASAALLLDSFHEVSELLDRASRDALRRCLETRRAIEGAARRGRN